MPNIADIIEVAEELEDKAVVPASKRCVAVRNRNAKSFFMRGVREGFFCIDVDFDIVLRICQKSMEYAMRTEMYKEYDMKHLLHNILFLFLRGVCTAEGIVKLDAFIAENMPATNPNC